MTTNSFIFLLIAIFLISCMGDDDFNVPVPDGMEDPATGITANTTIAEVKSLYDGYLTEIISDLMVEGYVVSSDASGNFYKELYLQDHPSEPTAGIRLALDKSNLYLTFEMGRKLLINLKGLVIGEGDGDVLTLGREIDGDIEGISESDIPEVIIKSATVEPVTGKSILFSEITDAHIGMYVQIANTQVQTEEAGFPFVDPGAFFSSQRILESCDEAATFVMETSAYSDFSQLMTPEGSGTVSGIVSRDYNGNILLLKLNEASAIAYEEARCDADL